MAKIKIIASSRGLPASNFIEWATRCPISHVEVLFDDCIIGSRTSGVDHYPIESLDDNAYYRVGTLACTETQAKNFREYLESQIGKGYDWRAYLGFLLYSKGYQAKGKWFCSELVDAGLRSVGINLFQSLPTYFTTPRDIYINPRIQWSEMKIKGV